MYLPVDDSCYGLGRLCLLDVQFWIQKCDGASLKANWSSLGTPKQQQLLLLWQHQPSNHSKMLWIPHWNNYFIIIPSLSYLLAGVTISACIVVTCYLCYTLYVFEYTKSKTQLCFRLSVPIFTYPRETSNGATYVAACIVGLNRRIQESECSRQKKRGRPTNSPLFAPYPVSSCTT